MNAVEVFKYILKKHGYDALENQARFIAMVVDYANGQSDSDMRMLSVCCKSGILEFAKKVRISGESNVLDLAYKEKLRLVDSEYISESCATRGINIVLESLGMSAKLKESTAVSVGLSGIERSLSDPSRLDVQAGISDTSRNEIDAIRINVRAARSGDAKAMVYLGDLLSNGCVIDNYGPIVVSKNLRLAASFYLEATKIGCDSIQIEAEHKYTQLVLQLKG